MDIDMLPPVAWLRRRSWGRDVASIARGEIDRVEHADEVWKAFEADGDPIQTVIDSHAYTRVMGVKGSTGARRAFERADALLMMEARLAEAETAELLADFVEAGQQTRSLSAELVRLALDGDGRTTCGEVSLPARSIYLRAEGLEGTTGDGHVLDGFLITLTDPYPDDELKALIEEDEDFDPHLRLFVMPLSRSLPPLEGARSPTPMLRIALGNPDLTLHDAIGQALDAMEERAESFVGVRAEQLEVEVRAQELAREEIDEKVETTLMKVEQSERDALRMKLETIRSRRERQRLAYLRADAELAPTHRALISKQVARIRPQAESWAAVIGAAMEIMKSGRDDVECRIEYLDGAPDDLVRRALSGATGSRKAEQKLAAAGYSRTTAYDLSRGEAGGSAIEADGVTEEHDAGGMPIVPATVGETAEDADRADASGAATRVRRNGPRGRARRDAARGKAARGRGRGLVGAEEAASGTVDMEDAGHIQAVEEPASASMPAATDAATAAAATASVHAPVAKRKRKRGNGGADEGDPLVLLEMLDEILHRCLRDLPAIGSRNWEATVPPALAAMVMRRARVHAIERETPEAARRRIAAGIAPRLAGLEEHLNAIRREEAANPDLRRAVRIGRPSVARDLDDLVLKGVAHPLLVQVDDDAGLAGMLAFPGVNLDEADERNPRTTIVRAWRDGQRVLLDGIVHAGCMVGYRRVELDPGTDEIRLVGEDSDHSQIDELVDALQAVVCDAVLGPVDEADAWMHQRRRRPASPAEPRSDAREPRTHHAENEPSPVTANGSGGNVVADRAADDAAGDMFRDWASVSARGCGPVGEDALLLTSAHCVLRAVERAFRQQDGDDVDAEVSRALARHLDVLEPTERPRVLTSPALPDDADLSPHVGRAGVAVITDRALVEQASPGLLSGRTALRERPVAMLYRIAEAGTAVLLVQADARNDPTFAQWALVPTRPDGDEEDDLSWYLRGMIALALDEDAPVASDVGKCPETPRLDARPAPATAEPIGRTRRAQGRAPEYRQGPRRVVAQARLFPHDMTAALRVVERWFDATAQRHGDMLIEDRREDGEWVLEHASEDRGATSMWSVTVRSPTDRPEALDVLLRTTLATGVRPRLPSLVREMAEEMRVDGPDGPLLTHPPIIRTRPEVVDLVRHLQSPQRVLPTLLMTQDRDGLYARQPTEIARQCLGAMNVRVLVADMTFDLEDVLGQEYRTFGGAVRMFQPRFDPDVDPASRHPRAMNDVGIDRQISAFIDRATASTVTRYDIPDVFRAIEKIDVPPPRMQDVPNVQPRPVVEAPAVDPDQPPLPFERAAGESEREAADGEERATMPVIDATAAFGPTQVEDDHQPDQTDVAAATDDERDAPVTEEKTDAEAEAPDVVSVPGPEEGGDARPYRPTDHRSDGGPAPSYDTAMDVRVEHAVARGLERLGIGELLATVSGLASQVETLTRIVSEGSRSAVGSDARDGEIAALKAELQAERQTMTDLLEEAEAERAEASARAETLRQALNDRRRSSEGGGEDWPSDLSGLADWLDRNVLPNVVIVTKAWREMRRVRYTDMERLCRALMLLDGPYIDMRAGIDGAREKWEEGLKQLRLDTKVGTKMGMSIRGGGEYSFRFENAVWKMDRHLRGIESLYNETDRLLRIYYTYDPDSKRVLIGHLPTHLTTIDS